MSTQPDYNVTALPSGECGIPVGYAYKAKLDDNNANFNYSRITSVTTKPTKRSITGAANVWSVKQKKAAKAAKVSTVDDIYIFDRNYRISGNYGVLAAAIGTNENLDQKQAMAKIEQLGYYDNAVLKEDNVLHVQYIRESDQSRAITDSVKANKKVGRDILDVLAELVNALPSEVSKTVKSDKKVTAKKPRAPSPRSDLKARYAALIASNEANPTARKTLNVSKYLNGTGVVTGNIGKNPPRTLHRVGNNYVSSNNAETLRTALPLIFPEANIEDLMTLWYDQPKNSASR